MDLSHLAANTKHDDMGSTDFSADSSETQGGYANGTQQAFPRTEQEVRTFC